MGGVVPDETALPILEIDMIGDRIHQHPQNYRIEGDSRRERVN
jgi:hypothetical protein